MRTQSLTALLVAALLVLSVTAFFLSVRYYFSLKQLQKLQGQNIRVNQTMAAVRSLAIECVRYGATNASINPILEQFELKQTNNASPDMPLEMPVANP